MRRKRRVHDAITTERRSRRANPTQHHGDPAERHREVLLRAVARQFYW